MTVTKKPAHAAKAPMRIENHRLAGHKFVADSVRHSPIIPRLIVIHYAVIRSVEDTVAALLAKPESAHFVVLGSDVAQMVPCNERAGHAGKSHWGGLLDCNDFSIGIEIANPGPLHRVEGQFVDVEGVPWPGGVYTGFHSADVAKQGWAHWAAFDEATIASVEALCKTLIAAYPTIQDVRGHDEIAPGRKIDPGPAFPMKALRAKLFGTEPSHVPPVGIKVI